ncbi:MAG: HAMP domain-containing protein [Halapricum sp.]
MSSEQSGEGAQSSGGGGVMGVVRKITPNVIRRSFALKFGIALLVLGLSVGAVGFVGSQMVKKEFRKEVNDQMGSLAVRDSRAVNQWVVTNSRQTGQLSRLPIVQTDNTTKIHQWLIHERTASTAWGGTGPVVHYVDLENKTVLASTDPGTYEGTSFSKLNATLRKGLNEIKFGQDVKRTNAYVDQEGTVRIAFLKVLPSSSNSTRAIAYTISPRNFASGGNIGGGQSGVTMIVDSQNRVIMEQTGSSEIMMKKYDAWSKPITDARKNDPGNATVSLSPGTASSGGILSGKASNRDYELKGQRYVVAASKVSSVYQQGIKQDIPWVVLVHTNQNQAYGHVEAVSNNSLYATLIGVLLIGVFGIVLGRNTSQAIDRLKGKAEEMEEGNLDVDLYSPRDDQIGRLYDGFANMRDALRQQIDEAEQARKEAEVSRAEAMEMSNYLQGKADEYAEIMQQCASGDLTQRMDVDGENEAMDRIASEFNEMIDELEKTTGQLKSFADEVETAGDVVQTSSESVRDASEQVADSVQKISDDAYNQKERLQEISNTMDGIATDLETFAAENDVDFGESLDRIEEIATMLNDVVDLSEETMAEAENVAGAAEEQAAELNEVTQRAEDLSRYARPLREVLDRFETESEHEFYFPTGPGSGDANVPDDE